MEISKHFRYVISKTFDLVAEFHHEMITPEHILLVILKDKTDSELLKAAGVNIGIAIEYTEGYLRTYIPEMQDKNTDPVASVGFRNILARAINNVQACGKKLLTTGAVLVSMLEEVENGCSLFLYNSGVNRLKLMDLVSHSLSEDDTTAAEENDLFTLTSDIDDGDFNSFGEDSFKDNIPGGKTGDFSSESERNIFETFVIDMVEEAKAGKYDPLLGREKELNRTLEILGRRTKNNPLHVGEPGVGKTAITCGLANLIANGKLPPALNGIGLYKIDMATLVAGSKYRGDFEERLLTIIKELSKKTFPVLYIDELQTIVKAGSGDSDSMDASAILKPVLAEGKIRCIGSITYQDYSKFIEKDRALQRRFQKIDIPEPTREETIKIISGLKKRYEDFHKVIYPQEILEYAVDLSGQYIRDQFWPDKAIDVIDEAGACIKTYRQNTAENEYTVVQKEVISEIVAKIAKVPKDQISTSEKEAMLKMEKELPSVVIGQPEAVKKVLYSIKRSRAGFRNPEKTISNFLFVGPTGVGKTLLAKTLAQLMGIPLIRFDMSEYQEKHTVSRLIGAPPGYVGSENGGLLTDAIRRQPHSVLLLDEVEKAHSDIYNVLLQVMDYASLTDSQGRKADFRNVILIMTSNAGASEIGKNLIGFGAGKISDSALKAAVERIFPPEFRNRLDAVVPFTALSRESIGLIVQREIKKISLVFEAKNKKLSVSSECFDLITDLCFNGEFGARDVERIIEEKIVSPLIDSILYGENTENFICRVFVDKGKITTEMRTSKAREHIKLN